MNITSPLHFVEQGRGFPLLLIHGLGASHFSFRENLGPLGRHFRVLAPDLPAHGLSPADPGADYRLETLAQTLLGFLDRRGVDQAAVAGNSLGGSLALLLAQMAPERIRGLILLAPGVPRERLPWITYPLRPPILGWLAAGLMGPWIMPWALRLAYHRHELITPAVIAGYAAPFRKLRRRLALRRLVAQLEPWSTAKIEALLREVTQPAIILWGEKDRILPVSQAPWLKAHLPQAELRLLKEVGHAPQEEVPDLVNEIIIAFLEATVKELS